MNGPDATSLRLEWLPGLYAVCRLDADAPLPPWCDVHAHPRQAGGIDAQPSSRTAQRGGSNAAHLLSVTRTARELSIVIDEARVPEAVRAERGFAALQVDGPLEFSMTGVLSRLAGALAAAGVPVLAVSTFDTDILLVRAAHAARAEAALRAVATVRGGA